MCRCHPSWCSRRSLWPCRAANGWSWGQAWRWNAGRFAGSTPDIRRIHGINEVWNLFEWRFFPWDVFYRPGPWWNKSRADLLSRWASEAVGYFSSKWHLSECKTWKQKVFIRMSLSTSHQAPEKIVPEKRGLCWDYFYKGILPAFPLLLMAPKSCNRKEALSGDYFSGFRCKKHLFSPWKKTINATGKKSHLTPSSGAGEFGIIFWEAEFFVQGPVDFFQGKTFFFWGSSRLLFSHVAKEFFMKVNGPWTGYCCYCCICFSSELDGSTDSALTLLETPPR